MDSFLEYIIEMYYKLKRRGLYPVNLDWDEKLVELLDSGEILEVGTHTCFFKKDNKLYKVWIANFPYAYGSLDGVAREEDLEKRVNTYEFSYGWSSVNDKQLPKASTAFRLKKVLDEYDRLSFRSLL